MDWSIKVSDLAIVAATFLGPVIAIQAQKRLEQNREIRSRRAWIFRTLMATRATKLAPTHVEAINAIPIEFYGRSKSLKRIIDAWKIYIDHLGDKEMDRGVWNSKMADLFLELLYSVSQYLGYEFDKVQLSKEVYYPIHFNTQESENNALRSGLLEIISGERAVKMDILSIPQISKS